MRGPQAPPSPGWLGESGHGVYPTASLECQAGHGSAFIPTPAALIPSVIHPSTGEQLELVPRVPVALAPLQKPGLSTSSVAVGATLNALPRAQGLPPAGRWGGEPPTAPGGRRRERQ